MFNDSVIQMLYAYIYQQENIILRKRNNYKKGSLNAKGLGVNLAI